MRRLKVDKLTNRLFPFSGKMIADRLAKSGFSVGNAGAFTANVFGIGNRSQDLLLILIPDLSYLIRKCASQCRFNRARGYSISNRKMILIEGRKSNHKFVIKMLNLMSVLFDCITFEELIN